jgi:PPOX class probable F420-dependent enzyme
MAQALTPNGTSESRAAALALFADGLRFASLATVNADHSPHQTVIWYIVEGDTIVLNGAEGRVWITNLQRDPRLSLSVEDGYRWMSVRGTVDRVDRGAIAQADAAISARHYHAAEPLVAEDLIHGRFELQERVSFRLSLATSKLYYHED